MNKIDFIKNFTDSTPFIEHGLKISNNSFNVDRVNISLQQDISKEELLNIVFKLFDDFDNTKIFIDKIYNEREDEIQQIYLGYSKEATEIYFECFKPGEPSYCLSYNSTDKQQNEYYPLVDHEKVVNEFVGLITEKTYLTILEPNEVFKGGFVREGNIYYILILEPLSRIGNILKSLCYNINPNEKENIDIWFDEHKDKIISNIAYTIKNNQLILNIYVNESTRTN